MIEGTRYRIKADKVEAEVEIKRSPEEFVPIYFLRAPEIEPGTMALMEKIRERLLAEISVRTTELLDPRAMEELKKKFYEKAIELIKKELPGASEKICEFIAGTLIHEMLGLGKLELLVADGNLEEIVINNSREPVWVFHKKYGWLKTNIIVPSESQIENYASIIGRKVGRQITILNPLMDAHLITGDRVNSTLFPISTKGNTLTIRKFRRKPWVITDLIENKTLNLEVAALLWSAVEYEINIIVSGGTASGKSVTGDTMVFTSYCGIEEIAKLYEEFKRKYGEKKLDEVYTIVEIPREFRFFIPSLNECGEVELKPVSRIWRKKSYPEIFELKLVNGTLIRTTPEHPFFMFDGQEIKKVRTDELKEGCYIVSSSKINPFNEDKIDIFSELKKKPKSVKHKFLIEVDELTKRKFIESFISKFKYWKRLKEFHYSFESIKKLLNKNLIPYELLEKVCVYPENVTRIGWLRSSILIKIPKLDYNFGRLLGLICGDGSLGIRNGGRSSYLEITNEKEGLREEFIELIKKLFGINEITTTVKASNRIAISLRSIVRFLSEIIGIPVNDKATNWAVPKVVAKGTREIISGFISGLIDTDGNVGNGDIEIITKSEIAAKQLPYLFHLFGAITNVSEKFVKDKKYYRIRTRDLSDLTKYVKTKYKKILSKDASISIPIDGEKLKEILKEIHGNVKNLPNYETLRTYWSCSKSKKRNPSINSLRSIIAFIENHPKFKNLSNKDKEIVKNWKLLADKKIVLFKIERLKKIKSEDKWLYDFSVEDNHNFLAGNFGCCFVSNTTFLNVLMSFIPPNQRIVSIEDTRELSLPSFLHWVPLTTRAPNPEGIGGVDMLDLMVNSLRMRPDRIVVGEIRRQDQAEVLFEAMHTGHSVYATLHADTAEQTYRRLVNPPINVPETMLEALHLIVAMFRDRRRGIRRIFQVAEVVPVEAKEVKNIINTLYRWKPFEDEIVRQEKSLRLIDELKLHTGMTDQEFEADINDKKKILSWMLANKVKTVDGVGKVVCEYYYDPERVLEIVEKNKPVTSLVPRSLLVEPE